MFMPDRVKALREARGLSQEEFAAILKVSANLIARYEMGNRQPSRTTLERLAKALRTTPGYLNPPDGVPETEAVA